MAKFDTIKTAIDANINTNGNQAITGSVMNSVLKQMVDSTDAELTELESEKANNYISNSIVVNSAIKELYISTPFDISQEVVFRFYYLQGNQKITGFTIFDKKFNVLCDAQKAIDNDEQLKAWTTTLFTNGKNFFAVVDWSKVQEICAAKGYGYDDINGVVLHKEIFDINFAPTIKAADVEKGLKSKFEGFDNEPMLHSNNAVKSDGIQKAFIKLLSTTLDSAEFSQYYYQLPTSEVQITRNSNSVVATIPAGGNPTNFIFGLGRMILKANQTYRLRSVYKNDGLDVSELRGILTLYRVDGGGRHTQQLYDVQELANNMLAIECILQNDVDLELERFAMYYPYSKVYDNGASITYLDSSVDIIQESSIEDGAMQNQIKKILAKTGTQYDNIIDVYPNGQPCQIANLIRTISDANAYNKYCIYVHKGEYEEMDIATKDYVDIVGESKQETILKCTGNATYLSPKDYSFDAANYSNIPVNEIPWQYKHLFFHMSQSTISNMTLIAVNDCKYIVHQDSRYEKFTASFENCIFKNKGATQIIGIGARGGQFFNYKNCLFYFVGGASVSNRSGMNLHNWNDQTDKCGIAFENCIISHCGYIGIFDLGSGNDDHVDFINCVTDNPETTYLSYDAETNDVGYAFTLNVVGGNLHPVISPKRKDVKLYVQSSDLTIGTTRNNDIEFGVALSLPYLFIAANGDSNFAFALYQTTEQCIASKFDVGYGLCESGEYNANDEVYINNGVFSKTSNGKAAAIVKVATSLDTRGYVLLQKL